MKTIVFTIENGEGGEARLTATGRDAWALMELYRAGQQGCTPIDNPGPRWSAYVHNLRKMGVGIATNHEAHKGPFPGTHARYVLKSPVHIEAVEGGAE